MGNTKVRLSPVQVNALTDAAGVNAAELTQFRSTTRNKLLDLGLIDELENQGLYVLSRNGLEWLIKNAPDTFISPAHLFNVGDIVRNRYMGPVGIVTAVHENGLYVEFHSHTEGTNYGAVSAYVAATDSEIDQFQRDDWHPTFIQGTDDSDPVLEVLGSDIVEGESVVWVRQTGDIDNHRAFTLEADSRLTRRYWRAYPVQAAPTKWRVERNSTALWRDEDRAMAHVASDIMATRAEAMSELRVMLMAEIQGWTDLGMSAKRDELILSAVTDMPNRSSWRVDGVEWSIRGW